MTNPFSRVAQGGPTRAPAVAVTRRRPPAAAALWPCASGVTSVNPAARAAPSADGEHSTGMDLSGRAASVGAWAWSGRAWDRMMTSVRSHTASRSTGVGRARLRPR